MKTITITFLRLSTATLEDLKRKPKGGKSDVDNLLLEDGCKLLLEDGNLILI